MTFAPDILQKEHPKIIIAIDNWSKVAQILVRIGYKIFKDFLPYTYVESSISLLDMRFLSFLASEREKEWWIHKFANGRKICATYGLCHMNIYKRILSTIKAFNSKYIILDLPFINNITAENYYVLREDCVWKVSDLIVCGIFDRNVRQTMTGTCPELSEIQRLVKDSCRIVRITGAAFKGYFPQHSENRSTKIMQDGKSVQEYFGWGDKNINRMYAEGKSIDEIKQLVLSDSYYDEEKSKKYFENELNILKRTESNCDVKIADYIEILAQEEVTHYSFTHPIPKVMLELTKRLLDIIGIEDNIDAFREEAFLKLDANEEIVYPSILKAYNLKNSVNSERMVKPGQVLFDGRKLTVEEYVEKYIQYVCMS